MMIFMKVDLEQVLITHLQKFLLELGRGFSFVARQKRIRLLCGLDNREVATLSFGCHSSKYTKWKHIRRTMADSKKYTHDK